MTVNLIEYNVNITQMPFLQLRDHMSYKSSYNSCTEFIVEGSDICPAQGTTCNPAGEPFGNRLYRYELVDNKLVNSLLLLDLSSNHNRHNGGPVVIGPDHNVYLAIGDISHRTKAQNYKERKDAD